MQPASCVVLGAAAGAVVLSWLYFRRCALARPPLGVLGLGDVALVLGGVVVVPCLYLTLPRWGAAALLAAGMLGVLHLTLEPALPARRAGRLAVPLIALADVAALRWGPYTMPYFVVNDVVVLVAVVGVANLWAQSGLRARDATLLAAGLTVYDWLATWRLPLMGDLFGRLAGLPFAPLLGWPLDGPERWLVIGFGDLLMAAVFPLVTRKAFGRPAGLAALAVSVAALAAVLALPLRQTFPVMVVLGPLLVLQYAYWRRRRGRERTTADYLREEPGSRISSLPPPPRRRAGRRGRRPGVRRRCAPGPPPWLGHPGRGRPAG